MIETSCFLYSFSAFSSPLPFSGSPLSDGSSLAFAFLARGQSAGVMSSQDSTINWPFSPPTPARIQPRPIILPATLKSCLMVFSLTSPSSYWMVRSKFQHSKTGRQTPFLEVAPLPTLLPVPQAGPPPSSSKRTKFLSSIRKKAGKRDLRDLPGEL